MTTDQTIPGSTAWLNDISVVQMQREMDEGTLTSVQLTTWYLHRIARHNQGGANINAVLEVNPDALQIAAALDEERRVKGPRGPLHGIPVLVKDNIDTCDKMHTTAGSVALAGSYALEDAFLVKQLRVAGALIIGKANLTEWANFMADNMPNGFSSLGGQVQNPYGPGQHDTGGSSAGTGAGIAACFAAVGVGTETSGSILSPASQNSLVGIKPTVGLISRTGVIPISHSQDTAGPMTRSVADAALLLGVLAGPDEADPATAATPERGHRDYTPFLVTDGLQGSRIGVVRGRFLEELSDHHVAILERGIEELKENGATVVELGDPFTSYDESDYRVLVYEFKTDLNAYLARRSVTTPVHSLQEVIAFNEAQSEAALKHCQAILLASQETSGRLTEVAYHEARHKDIQSSRENGIDKVMTEQQVDALLFINNWGAGIAAKAGYPSITVPAGYTPNGEPVGLTFTAQAFEEPMLIRLGYSYEQATRCRQAPVLD
jgi:amidase